jgi:hypothetical protein
MVSELALEDIARIEREGGKVAPRDVVWLNSLALRITADPACTLGALPRVCVVEDVLIRQPSISQDILLDELDALFDHDEGTTLAIEAYVLSHGVTEMPRHPRMFALKVQGWLRATFHETTAAELRRAVDYVLYGATPEVDELPPIAEQPEKDEERADMPPHSSSLADWQMASSLGIDSTAALAATSETLAAMIETAYIVRHKCPLTKEDTKRAGDYYRALEEVRSRSFPKKLDEGKK